MSASVWVPTEGGDSPMCQGGYKIPRRTKGVIWSSQGRRPSLFLLNKIHQDSVSLCEYITFAKITGEREISLQTVTPAFKAIWEEVQTLTTDGISNDRLFPSLSHPFTYQSFWISLCTLTACNVQSDFIFIDHDCKLQTFVSILSPFYKQI